MATSPFLIEDFVAPDGTLLENIGSGLVRSTVSGNNGAAQVMNNRATQGSATVAVYCWGGNPAPSPDYEVSAKYFFNSGIGNPSVGVCARMAGPAGAPLTFYQARLVNNSSGLVLARFLNGAGVTLLSTPMNFAFGDEPKVTLRMQGDQLSVLVNDQLALGPHPDSTIPAAGYLGLRMASANVNQIRVTEVRAMSLDNGPAPIAGQLSSTLDGATISSSAQVQVAGALSKSLAPATLASAAAIASTAGLTKNLAPAVLTASAYIEAEPPQQDGVEGTLSRVLAAATLAASASVAVRGALGATLDDSILASTAATTIAAALTRALEPAVLAATVTRPMAAKLEATLEDATLSATFRIYLMGTVRAPAGAGYTPQRAAVTARPAQTGGHRPPATQETTR